MTLLAGVLGYLSMAWIVFPLLFHVLGDRFWAIVATLAAYLLVGGLGVWWGVKASKRRRTRRE